VGLLAVETSTGDIQYGVCSTGLVQSQLEAALLSVAPVEVLAVGPLSQQVRPEPPSRRGPAWRRGCAEPGRRGAALHRHSAS
jgi:DNA mismatch repair protein MSH3